MENETTTEFGNVQITLDRRVLLDGKRVALTKTQLDIVEALVRARGRYLSHDFLSDLLNREIYDEAIRQYVRRTRCGFALIDPAFDQIEARRGFKSYRWRYRPALGAEPSAA